MKEMLERLAGESPEDDNSHAEAKMQVLNELRDMAMEMMGEKVKGKLPGQMHGVEVMAPDKEGLEKGLDLAKAVLPEESPEEESMEEKLHPGIHEEVEEQMSPGDDMYDDMSPEELDEEIQRLKELKQAKLMR